MKPDKLEVLLKVDRSNKPEIEGEEKKKTQTYKQRQVKDTYKEKRQQA